MVDEILAKKRVVDAHSHILYGADDGSDDLQMSLEMIDMLDSQSCETIMITPHSWSACKEGELRYKYLRLKGEVENLYCDLKIYLGMEILCSEENIKQVIHGLNSGCYFSMNNTKYVMIEFKEDVIYLEVYRCVKKLISNGWFPVIAHAERYIHMTHSLANIKKLKELGCLIQVNYYSLVDERRRPRIKRLAENLLHHKLIDILGSDCHKTYHREPFISNGISKVLQWCEREYAENILFNNAINKFNLMD